MHALGTCRADVAALTWRRLYGLWQVVVAICDGSVCVVVLLVDLVVFKLHGAGLVGHARMAPVLVSLPALPSPVAAPHQVHLLLGVTSTMHSEDVKASPACLVLTMDQYDNQSSLLHAK